MEEKVTAIGYETVQTADGRLPILAPMSEVAGRMAPQVGACLLERPHGGRGILLGGVAGVSPGHVVILGAGNAGINAAYVAVGMGAKVTVIDISLDKLRFLEEVLYGKLTTMVLNQTNLENTVYSADLVICAVLIPGAKAPVLVTEEMVKQMKKGSVIIDISVDQGGCVETTQPTTHAKPVFLKDGVIHYGVTNMPGAVPFTSTLALTNVTLPYVLKLAELGLERAVSEDIALAKGVNVYRGNIVCKPVAEAHDLKFRPLDELLKKFSR
jgi:alanine dehydrogenase